MLRLTLAAGLLAAVLLPTASMAQPYGGPPPDQGYGSDQNDNDRGDNGDQGYQGGDQDMNDNGGDQDRGDDRGNAGPPPNQGYNQDNDRGDGDNAQYRPAGGRQHFTGRVGSSWRDANGQDCQWREVSRRDADGYAAYKWIPVCR